MKKNKTFQGSNPTWANACVGNNGSPTYVEYAQGFSAAANLMLALVIEGEGLRHSVDEFIYPICFNMRHSIELRLKGTIEKLQRISMMKGRKLNFDLQSSHDLGNIWDFVKVSAIQLDKRYSAVLTKLDEYIQDIAEVDATGQTFRYPTDQDRKKHLTEISIINIVILKIRFKKLEELLDYLHRFNIFIEEEYSLKTFTNNLSRSALFHIAQILPQRDAWKNDSFDAIKKNIKGQFSIGSKELSNAIKLIENNYELSQLISIKIPLKGAESKDFYTFFNEWFKLHNIDDLRNPAKFFDYSSVSSEPDLEGMHLYRKVKQEVLTPLCHNLNPEAVAGLSALFEFGRNIIFSEIYIRMYEINLQISTKSHKRNFVDFKEHISHLLEKTSAFENIVCSLYFLGYDKFANELLKNYELESCIAKIEKAKSRELFKKPDFWGYHNIMHNKTLFTTKDKYEYK